MPLWTEIGGLMPRQPKSQASPHLWRWSRLKELAAEAGRIVPVGRGGERRAIALANPSLGGRPYATPTLWAAIQYLMPGEDAPEHRHTQHAFRFVVEGEGVWTVVNGDAVRMSRGDFLLRPAGTGIRTTTPPPSRWPGSTASTFRSRTTPRASSSSSAASMSLPPRRPPPSARAPSACGAIPGCGRCRGPTRCRLAAARLPLGRHRSALAEQLALEDEGEVATLGPGHAAVRFTNPTSGGDVLPTMRTEMHRLRAGARTLARRETGSSVFQVFDGAGTVGVGERRWSVERGDLFVVPSWQPFTAEASPDAHLDLFRFSDTPIFETLRTHRVQVDG